VGEESTITFKAAPWAEEDTRISVSVLGSVNTTITPSIFTLTPGQWTECTATIKGKGDITVSLTPSNNRFFLDDIKVVAGNNPTAIQGIAAETEANSDIFGIDGRKIGKDKTNLPHGIYIINKKKVIR
jgi:hypothetical protein